MIEHVRQQLAEKYSNYELVITEVHDYYDIPISSFDYMDGILGVFVPLFIRPSLQEPINIQKKKKKKKDPYFGMGKNAKSYATNTLLSIFSLGKGRESLLLKPYKKL